MIARMCFSIVLRGQLPTLSQAGTKGEVVSAEDSPGSSGCASDMSTLHLAPREVLEVESVLGTLDATQNVSRNPGLPREEH